MKKCHRQFLRKLITAITITIIPTLTLAQTISTIQAEAKPMFCPKPSQLVKEGLWWKADNTWKSYSESFVEEIARFTGAQWIGVEVGTVICLYKGKNDLAFPVALEPIYTLTALAPKGGKWQASERGYKKCLSNDVELCPFYKQKTDQPDDLYAGIKYKKNKGCISSDRKFYGCYRFN